MIIRARLERYNAAFLVGVLCSFPTLAIAQKQPAATDPASVAWKAVQRGDPGDYIGAEKCASCHKAEATQFAKTPHARIPAYDNIAGCEVCHGPGKAHADAVSAARGDDAKIAVAAKLIFGFHAKPTENSARCMVCHITSKEQDQFQHSEHSMRGLSCNECHSPHLVEALEQPGRTELTSAQPKFFNVPVLPEETRWLQNSLLKDSQPQLCFGCHRNVQAQFSLPVHHRVPEGLMKCTDCHSPHGTRNPSNLRKTNWETCVGCHTEKRGPFVFEHAAVRVEGCTACHMPHGDVNQNLLARRESRLLCLQCHVDPFANNVPHGRFGFQTSGECTRCHVNIHGSNFNEFFLQ